MAEGGAAVRAPFELPARAAARAATERRSSPLAFGLGVVWLAVILSGVIAWAFRSLSGNYFYVFMGIFLPYFLTFRLRQAASLASRPQFWLWILTAFVPIVLFVTGSSDPWATESMKARIISFSIVAGSALVLVAPDARQMLRVSALIVLALAIPICFVELVAGSIFSVAEGRAAGLYGNPNDAGAALLVCLLFAVDLRSVTSGGLLLAAATTAAVFATFSRSAMLFAIALFTAYALAPRLGARGQGAQRVVMLGLIAVIAAAGIAWLSQNLDLSDEAAMRLQSLLSGNLSDSSTKDRIQLAEYSLQIVRENFWGSGLGTVERRMLEPHNTYLYLAIDYGIPGLLVYLTILFAALGSALRAGWRRGANAIVIALLLMWSSLFTHYVATAGFFAVAFASFISSSLVAPREEGAPAGTAASAEEPFRGR